MLKLIKRLLKLIKNRHKKNIYYHQMDNLKNAICGAKIKRKRWAELTIKEELLLKLDNHNYIVIDLMYYIEKDNMKEACFLIEHIQNEVSEMFIIEVLSFISIIKPDPRNKFFYNRSEKSSNKIRHAIEYFNKGDTYKLYLLSTSWDIKRYKRLGMDEDSCAQCGREQYLHIHHLNYDNIYHEKMEDLITLCRDCHKKVHGIKNGEAHG